jgi:hypothetical protein
MLSYRVQWIFLTKYGYTWSLWPATWILLYNDIRMLYYIQDGGTVSEYNITQQLVHSDSYNDGNYKLVCKCMAGRSNTKRWPQYVDISKPEKYNIREELLWLRPSSKYECTTWKRVTHDIEHYTCGNKRFSRLNDGLSVSMNKILQLYFKLHNLILDMI